jgi:selenide,water dikinase
LSAAGEIIKGAQSVCDLAGIPLAGGHSIEAPEPFFGLQVNGITSKERLKKNNNVHLGDVLLLSKPLGTGIITTAAKKEKAEASHLDEAIASMTKLNDLGIALSKLQSVHAMTDITGFGLLGHLLEMIGDTEVSVSLSDEQIPTFSFLKSYLDQFIYPDMTTKNFSAVTSKVTTLDARQLFTFCDPQTSGGLLISVAPEGVDEVIKLFKENNVHSSCLNVIGNVISKEEKSIRIIC